MSFGEAFAVQERPTKPEGKEALWFSNKKDVQADADFWKDVNDWAELAGRDALKQAVDVTRSASSKNEALYQETTGDFNDDMKKALEALV